MAHHQAAPADSNHNPWSASNIKKPLIGLQLLKIVFGILRTDLVPVLFYRLFPKEVSPWARTTTMDYQTRSIRSFYQAVIIFYLIEILFTLLQFSIGLLIMCILHFIVLIWWIWLINLYLSSSYHHFAEEDHRYQIIFEWCHSLLITFLLCYFTWQTWKVIRPVMVPGMVLEAAETGETTAASSPTAAMDRRNRRSSASPRVATRASRKKKTRESTSSTRSKKTPSSPAKTGNKTRESKSSVTIQPRSSPESEVSQSKDLSATRGAEESLSSG